MYSWVDKIATPEKVRGRHFQKLIRDYVSSIFEKSERIRELADDRALVVNEILMGGRFYGILEVFQDKFGYIPRTGYVKIESRVKPGSTDAEVMYNKVVDGDYMLIGDTVASGSTFLKFLELVDPEELHLITIGTKYGFEKIKEMFDGELYVYFIPFELNLNPKNLTDMPISFERTPEEFLDKLLSKTTENILKVQCIIGDFSDSMMDEPSFLSEWYAILVQMWKYLDYVGDEKGKKTIEHRIDYIVNEMKKWPVDMRYFFAHALTRRQRLKGYEKVFKPSEVELDIEKMASKLKDEDWDEFLSIQ